MAAACVGKTSLPAPQVSIRLAKDGRRLKNGKIGRDGVDDVGRKRRTKQRVLELDRALTEQRVILLDVGRDIASVT